MVNHTDYPRWPTGELHWHWLFCDPEVDAIQQTPDWSANAEIKVEGSVGLGSRAFLRQSAIDSAAIATLLNQFDIFSAVTPRPGGVPYNTQSLTR